MRWIYAQSLPDLRVISTGIARKLGAISEQIRRKSRTNPTEIAREFFAFVFIESIDFENAVRLAVSMGEPQQAPQQV